MYGPLLAHLNFVANGCFEILRFWDIDIPDCSLGMGEKRSQTLSLATSSSASLVPGSVYFVWHHEFEAVGKSCNVSAK